MQVRRRFAWLALVGALLLPAAACGGGTESLEGTSWQPTDLGGIPVVEGSDAFVAFGTEPDLNGSTGCNSFTGGWSAAGGDGSIEILTGAMTLAACATEELQAVETAFLAALNAALFYEGGGDTLTLLDGDKNQLAELATADTAE